MKLLGTVVILLLLTTSVFGGSGTVEKNAQAGQINQEKQNLSTTQVTLDLLSHTVDLWHDAGLKGNRKEVRFHQREIETYLQQDLKATEYRLNRAIDKASRAPRVVSEPGQERADLADDRKDVKQIKSTYSVKQQLSASFVKSNQFSNKYRLINDYLALLKRELRSERIELVEEVVERRRR